MTMSCRFLAAHAAAPGLPGAGAATCSASKISLSSLPPNRARRALPRQHRMASFLRAGAARYASAHWSLTIA
jgi:hypothetical protein